MLRNGDRACVRLEALRRSLEEAARRGVAGLAEAAAEEAARRAPVDTGRLRASIRARADGLSAAVTADCPYAAAVELGTSRRPPQPYLVPAAESVREAAAERFGLKG